MAKEYWRLFSLRNSSFISDYFMAQLKTTFTCSQCLNLTINFDPFYILDIQLPKLKDRIMNIILLKNNNLNTIPIRYSLKINKDANFNDLFNNYFDILSVDPQNIVLYNLYNNYFFTRYSLDDPILSVPSHHIIWAFVSFLSSFYLN